MRKQIAAANWKMNLTYQQGTALLQTIVICRNYLERKSARPFCCSLSLPGNGHRYVKS